MRRKPKILVTGATGKTGSCLVAQLRELDWPVRALVRKRSLESERLERIGVEVVVADIFDSESTLIAMSGIERAYYCTFFHPHLIQSSTAFALAAREAKLESVVSLGQWVASPSHPSLATRQTWLTDQLFSSLPGIAHTRVNPGYFADNYLRVISYAAQLGVLPTLTGASRNAPPSNEDIARVAVAALIDPAKHAGKLYRPTGPALISAGEIAVTLSRVLGRAVRRLDLPWWMFVRAARMQGVDAFQLSAFRHYVNDHKAGAFELGAPTDHVLSVTGRPAEDFESIARRYAARDDAQRNLGNSLRTLFDFMRNPFSPGYDLDRIDRQLVTPMPAAPLLAMRNATWRRSHEPEAIVAAAAHEP